MDENVLLEIVRKNINDSKKETIIEVNDWTEENEKEIKRLSNICKNDAHNLYKKGYDMTRYGKYINLSTIVFSALTIYVASSSAIASTAKDPIITVFGICTIILKGAYQVYNYSETGGILKEVSRGLDNLATNIRCEIYKPISLRKQFAQLIYDAQIERDQLLTKVDKAE
uniref:Uncharacterized protein n=1 Tax=viral metagenome TaxID=1070528 RepID=A0A6C0DLA7_9ZZZZ